jgi:serine/threonine protein phosphatase PrpC
MTRSFGDLIAASVGVSPIPDVWCVICLLFAVCCLLPAACYHHQYHHHHKHDHLSRRVRDIDPSIDAFFMLASDGVWEFIESDEGIAICGKLSDKPWDAVVEITQESRKR